MRRAALVSTAWRHLAQERLWRGINIDSPLAVVQLVTTPRDTVFQTRVVQVAVDGACELIGRLLSVLRGVKVLVVTDPAGVPLFPYFLEAHSMKHITKLHLDFATSYDSAFNFLNSVPTHLETISLGNSFDSLTLVLALLDASRCCLQSLEFQQCNSLMWPWVEDPESFSNDFIPLLPSLVLAQFCPPVFFIMELILRNGTELQILHLDLGTGLDYDGAVILDWLQGFNDRNQEEEARFPAIQLTLTQDQGTDASYYFDVIVELLESKTWPALRYLDFSISRDDMLEVAGAAEFIDNLEKREPPVMLRFSIYG
ncbi:hypothetical protein P7C70_g8190, partial [Phenoliferia sp. Uapishka_3]